MTRLIRLQLFAERREAPTEHRRRKARQQGRVFRSQEAVAALLLLSMIAVIQGFGPILSGRMAGFMSRSFLAGATADWSLDGTSALFQTVLAQVLLWISPLLLVPVLVGIGGSFLQGGFVLTAAPLAPQLNRLDPVQGLKRMFSLRAVVELVKSILKLLVLGAVAYWTIASDWREILSLSALPLPAGLAVIGRILLTLLWRAAVTLLLIAAADAAYQWWEHERSLRMSKEEIKQEHKDTEGDPQLRSLRRRRMREMARMRSLRDVPLADAVITNPTHYAVALRYVPEEMAAPVVLAKGRNLAALRIREIARKHAVPVMEDRLLARALYRSAKVGAPIPVEFYQAVAKVLAFVWHLRRRGEAGA